MKKLQFFYQNHELTALETCKFCNLFKSKFLKAKNTFFCVECYRILFLGLFRIKTKHEKTLAVSLYQNHDLTPLENANFVTSLNRRFYSLKTRVFYLQCFRILFLGLFFIKTKDEKISMGLVK